MTTIDVKDLARRMREAFSERCGVHLQHSVWLDALASAYGFGNWHLMSAFLAALDDERPARQITAILKAEHVELSPGRLHAYLTELQGISLPVSDVAATASLAMERFESDSTESGVDLPR